MGFPEHTCPSQTQPPVDKKVRWLRVFWFVWKSEFSRSPGLEGFGEDCLAVWWHQMEAHKPVRICLLGFCGGLSSLAVPHASQAHIANHYLTISFSTFGFFLKCHICREDFFHHPGNCSPTQTTTRTKQWYRISGGQLRQFPISHHIK